MLLPLIERAREDGLTFVMSGPALQGSDVPPRNVGELGPPLLPERALQAGEQYRFHFDMTRCIGCKCCIVACNEQNGNPAHINWRRVGEIEGGFYPNTQRFHLSMGCNHCLEPSCLIGCPVEAYTKDLVTGIVLHSAERCIGCQYCTWNCSYGVPQFNAERGVVGKCDMCYGRLAEEREPACVNACPERAIRVEIVNIEEWRREYAEGGNAPGLPSADDSISSTRITLPEGMPPDIHKADAWRVKLEDAHWPLVFMTVLTQLSVGAFATIWLLQLFGATARLSTAALGSLLVGGMALGVSTLHLGRPIHAYRALKMWRRSWLSREVLMFSTFSGMAGLYAGSLWSSFPLSLSLGTLTVLTGIAGVTASACIYLVRARPAWNSGHTVAEFFLTSFILGPLFAAVIGAAGGRWLVLVCVAACSAQLLNCALRFLRLIASDSFELQSSARLLSTVLASRLLLRSALLIGGGIALPLFSPSRLSLAVALVTVLTGEIMGRHLFYVSVVPKNMAASYLSTGKEAA